MQWGRFQRCRCFFTTVASYLIIKFVHVLTLDESRNQSLATSVDDDEKIIEEGSTYNIVNTVAEFDSTINYLDTAMPVRNGTHTK